MAADRLARTIPFWNLPAQYKEEEAELLPAIRAVLERGDFVGGDAIRELETALAARIGAKHVVAVNSGTDALALGLAVLGVGPGDDVITPPNSFVASTATIVHAGANPVFADVRPDQNFDPNAVAAAITPRTKAIMPVHMTGRIADMEPLTALAKRHGLAIIEDAAQSFGSTYKGRPSGTFGDIGCFSAHPLKNMNGAGDAGYIATNSDTLAARLHRLRNHGLIDRETVSEWGFNSRMDTLQAAVLKVRLKNLDSVIERKRRIVARYRERLNATHVFIPPCRQHEFNTFVLFVAQVDRREALRAHLAGHGIGTAIHYPVPIHLQPAAAALGYKRGDFPAAEQQATRILSLPVHQFLNDDDVDYVSDCINQFYASR